jgi:N-acetylglucosamine kinase-like BadF-type ATPase
MIEHLGLKGWDEMIGCINSRETTKADIASLAQVVAAAAQEGDDVAAEILSKAGDDLAELVNSVMTRGFGAEEQVQVCLYGSIVRNIALVHKHFAAALVGTATIVSADREPAIGAMLLGLEWIQQKE